MSLHERVCACVSALFGFPGSICMLVSTLASSSQFRRPHKEPTPHSTPSTTPSKSISVVSLEYGLAGEYVCVAKILLRLPGAYSDASDHAGAQQPVCASEHRAPHPLIILPHKRRKSAIGISVGYDFTGARVCAPTSPLRRHRARMDATDHTLATSSQVWTF